MVDYALFNTRPLMTWKHCGELRPGCPSPVRVLVESKIHRIMGVEEGLKKSYVSIFTSIEIVVVECSGRM